MNAVIISVDRNISLKRLSRVMTFQTILFEHKALALTPIVYSQNMIITDAVGNGLADLLAR